jgi:hypothetical protein
MVPNLRVVDGLGGQTTEMVEISTTRRVLQDGRHNLGPRFDLDEVRQVREDAWVGKKSQGDVAAFNKEL